MAAPSEITSQRSTNASSSGVTSRAITWPATPTAGNLLIISLSLGTLSTAVATPSGWTMLNSTLTTSNYNLITFYKIAAGSSADNVTVSGWASSTASLIGMEWTGVSNIVPIQFTESYEFAQSGSGATSLNITSATGNVITSSGGSATNAQAFISILATSTTITSPSFTPGVALSSTNAVWNALSASAPNFNVASGTYNNPTKSSGTFGWTWTTSRRPGAQMFALVPSTTSITNNAVPITATPSATANGAISGNASTVVLTADGSAGTPTASASIVGSTTQQTATITSDIPTGSASLTGTTIPITATTTGGVVQGIGLEAALELLSIIDSGGTLSGAATMAFTPVALSFSAATSGEAAVQVKTISCTPLAITASTGSLFRYTFTSPQLDDVPQFLPESNPRQVALYRHFKRRVRNLVVALLSDYSTAQDTPSDGHLNSIPYPWNPNDPGGPFSTAWINEYPTDYVPGTRPEVPLTAVFTTQKPYVTKLFYGREIQNITYDDAKQLLYNGYKMAAYGSTPQPGQVAIGYSDESRVSYA